MRSAPRGLKKKKISRKNMVSILTDNHVKTIENDITKVGKFSAVMRFFNANTSLFIEETSFKCPHLNCDERLRQGNHS